MKRNQLMQLLSVWGILLVVLGHSGFEEPIIKEELWWLHSWIYSFHMPLFFLISGFLFSYTNNSFVDLNPRFFLIKKVKRLLVPYFVIGTIVFLIKFAFSGLSHAAREFSFANFIFMFIAPSNPNSTMGYLWYIITLFVVFVIIIMLCKIGADLKKTPICLSFIVLFWILDCIMPNVELFNLKQAIHYAPYFLLGILMKTFENEVMVFVKNKAWLSIIIVGLLNVLLTIRVIYIPYYLDLVIRCLVGIWFSILICYKLLESDKYSKKVLQYSQYTYSIYILSWFGQYAAKVVFINFLHVHWTLAMVAMFVLGIAAPLLVDKTVVGVKVLRECKTLRLVIGY